MVVEASRHARIGVGSFASFVAYVWEALLAPICVERGVWVIIPIHAAESIVESAIETLASKMED